jgi:hypothetical protein
VLVFVVVVGYAGFGKGFAYAGYPPLFVGEVVLAVLLASAFGPAARFPRNAASGLTLALLGLALVQVTVDLSNGADPLETARGLAPLYYAGYAFGI